MSFVYIRILEEMIGPAMCAGMDLLRINLLIIAPSVAAPSPMKPVRSWRGELVGTMKILELFSGTGSIGTAFRERGHEVFSVDWDSQFQADIQQDILELKADDILEKFGRPDVIWASPDCTTYSIAAISHHRVREDTGNLAPVSEYAKFCDRVNLHTHNLIMTLRPRYWFVENPRGGMRKMDFMSGLPRYTVTYCRYGDSRMKPTDIWTNHPDPKFKPPCHNGDPCHVRAPRGAKTGTQGLKGSVERGKIPKDLCEHIVDICEEGMGINGGTTDVQR